MLPTNQRAVVIPCELLGLRPFFGDEGFDRHLRLTRVHTQQLRCVGGLELLREDTCDPRLRLDCGIFATVSEIRVIA